MTDRDPLEFWRIEQYQRLAAINAEKAIATDNKTDRIRFQDLARTYARIARQLMGVE